jgi:phospholipase/carboxylesterase
MHKETIIESGNTGNAKKALVMLHGRGSNAQDILSLSSYLNTKDYALYAPQATNNTWYPYSFLAEALRNEPWLSSALELVETATKKIIKKGIAEEDIYFLGFSQGACLTLEYIARNAKKYGGAVAFTGGLIGDKINTENYEGHFEGMPVFIGTSDPDPHVPIERIHATTDILKDMGADVTEKVYQNMGHTITEDEINSANNLIFR